MNVRVARDGAVARVCVEDPPDHLMSPRALQALRQAFEALVDDPAIRVVLFTGPAPGSSMLFLDPRVGLELRERLPPLPRLIRPLLVAGMGATWALLRRVRPLRRLLNHPDRALESMWLNMALLFDGIETSRLLTIAVFDGPCAGAGMELALACDLRVAADRADVILGQPEVIAGLVPGFGATQRLPRQVGSGAALALMLHGRPWSATEARDRGLVDVLLPGEGFEQALNDWVGVLAGRSPEALSGILGAVRAAVPPLGLGLLRELPHVMEAWLGDRAGEGLRAFSGRLEAERARVPRRPVAEAFVDLLVPGALGS